MRNVKKSLVTAAVLLSAGPLWAFNLSSEITELNRDFGASQKYPIVIMDKKDFRGFLKSSSIDGGNETALAAGLKTYLHLKYALTIEPQEAQSLTPYFSALDSHASAIPFFTGFYHREMKFCVVMPSSLDGTALDETQRVLGAQGAENLYRNVNVEQLSAMFSSDQYKIFSLYHELSHCLDQTFLPKAYQGEPDPYSMHRTEAFAEVNALLLLAQRKQIKGFGKGRALLRGIYAKILGPYLANADEPTQNILHEFGGSIYFLTRPIEAAEKELMANAPLRDLTQVLSLSKKIVLQHAIHPLGLRALHFAFKEGEEKAIAKYQQLAKEEPELFKDAFDDLLSLLSILRSLPSVTDTESRDN